MTVKRAFVALSFPLVSIAACTASSNSPSDAGTDAPLDAALDGSADAPDVFKGDANAVLCSCFTWDGPSGDICPGPIDAGVVDAGVIDAGEAGAGEAGVSEAGVSDASSEASTPHVTFSGNVRWSDSCPLPCGQYTLRICSSGSCGSYNADFCAKPFVPTTFDCADSKSPDVFVLKGDLSCKVR